MPSYAVIDNGNIINTIVAESKDGAELFSGKLCIEFTSEQRVQIGGTWDGVSFIEVQPYPSWTLNSDKQWEPPVPKPEGGANFYYVWNEDTLSWDKIERELNNEQQK